MQVKKVFLVTITFALIIVLMNANPQVVYDTHNEDQTAGTYVNPSPNVEYIPLTTPMPPGMLAYWELNEGGGSIVHDSISPYVHGSTAGSPVWPSAVAGTGLELLVNQYVDLTSSSVLNLPTLLTLEAWVYLYNPSGLHTIIVNEASPTTRQYHFAIENGHLYFNRQYGSSPNAVRSDGIISTNEWYHVAVSMDRNAGRVWFYINGVEDVARAYHDIYTGSYGLTTAGRLRVASGDPTFLNGMIDEIAVYNQIVPGSIIQQHYQNGLLGLGYLDDIPVNAPPEADDDNYATDEDMPLFITSPGVLLNDYDVDQDPLIAVVTNLPLHGQLDFSPDGAFSYTPDHDFFGGDAFTYYASDGEFASNVATVRITVNPLNDPPVAVNDAYVTDEDVMLFVPAPGVLTNDIDVDLYDLLTVELVTAPTHGTLNFFMEGDVEYTPYPDWYGTDSFEYRVFDTHVFGNIATVTITVHPVNDAPVSADDEFTIDEDTVLVSTLLSNDYDVDGDFLEVLIVSYPSHGTLTLISDQQFSYTPDLDWYGIDSFNYWLYDGIEYSATAQVTITVLDVIDDFTPPVTTLVPSGTLGDNDWYISDVTVTLSAIDDTSMILTTWYSTDGLTWIEYTSPFVLSLEGITTISFYSVDEYGNVEDTHMQDIKIDKTPPVTLITLDIPPGDLTPRNGWYLGNVIVTLTASDTVSSVAVTYYSLEIGVWLVYTGPFIISAEGVTTISFYSVDVAGNTEAIQESIVQIDRTPPIIEFDFDGELLINITDTVSGIYYYAYTVSGDGWVLSDSAYGLGQKNILLRLIIPFDGYVDVAAEAIDNAELNTFESWSFWFDITPPETTIVLEISPGDLNPRNGWYVSDVIVNLIATDALSEVVVTMYSLDGVNWMEYTGPFVVTTEGDTTVYFYSVDAVGNIEPTKQESFKIDKTLPEISFSFDGLTGLNGWFVSDGVLTISVTDQYAGINWLAYSITCGSWSISDTVYPADEHSIIMTFDITVEGVISVHVSVYDNLEFSTREDWAFGVDKTPPQTQLTTERIYGGVIVSLNAVDAASGIAEIFYMLNDNGWIQYSGPFILTSGRIVSISFYAMDVAGHVEEVQSEDIVVDVEPPETQMSFTGTIGDNGWYVTDVVATLTVTDEFSVSSTMYSFDEINWILYTGPFTITTDGLTTVYFYSIDGSGNIETTKSESIIIDTDTTGPIISITYTGDATDGSSGYWTVTVVDPESGIASITVEIDGVLVGTLSGNYPVPNILGLHTIRVNATNNDLEMGIEDQEFSTLSSTVTLVDDDTTGPQIQIVHSGGTTVSDPGYWVVTVTDPESGVAMIIVEVDGEIVGTTAGEYAVPATEGTHTITVTAYNEDNDRGETDQESSMVTETITISGESPPGCVAGIGWITDNNGRKGVFGFIVKHKPNGDVCGEFLYLYREGRFVYMVKSVEFLGLTIDGDHAYFEVMCSVTKINPCSCRVHCSDDGYLVRVDIWEKKGRGEKDIFQIQIFDPAGQISYDAGIEPVGYVHGTIVIHTYRGPRGCHGH